MVNKKTTIKIIATLLVILTSSMFAHSTNAVVERIEAYDGILSTDYIVRGKPIDIFATLVNIGNDSLDVISLNVMFVNINGSERFNTNYTMDFDMYHRTLGPQESMTATFRTTITNAASFYNVSIYFYAVDVYDSQTELPVPKNFFAARDVVVRVVDLGGSSDVVVGIGVGFVVLVGVGILVLLISYFRTKLKEKKY